MTIHPVSVMRTESADRDEILPACPPPLIMHIPRQLTALPLPSKVKQPLHSAALHSRHTHGACSHTHTHALTFCSRPGSHGKEVSFLGALSQGKRTLLSCAVTPCPFFPLPCSFTSLFFSEGPNYRIFSLLNERIL